MSRFRWSDPAWRAALVNGALFVVVPWTAAVYASYTSEVVHPDAPTLAAAMARAVPVALVGVPVGVLVMWRTYAHASAWRTGGEPLWRGPLESAAIAGGLALALMIPMTLPNWLSRPPLLMAAYIGFYVGATAVVGLLLGLVLTATGLLVLGGRRASARATD